MTVLCSRNPSTGKVVWKKEMTTTMEINRIVDISIMKQRDYQNIDFEERKQILMRFAQIVQDRAEELSIAISAENGKPLWEAKAEVNSLISKTKATISSFEERAKTTTKELTNGRSSITRFKPHGVLVVIGPYNFPMSMPNSHIMPALLAGNAIIFKPSEKTPMCAEIYAQIWTQAGLPDGVMQVVYGSDSLGKALVNNNRINGVLFIGSRRAGTSISRALAGKNDKLCVLEMGGNSPLVIWDYDDIRFAINVVIQSAFLTTGQRCSCARRIIVNSQIKEIFIPNLLKAVNNIVVGDAFQTDPEPFMGPLIDSKICNNFFRDYNELLKRGAKVLLEPKRLTMLGKNYVSPGLVCVMNMQKFDKEIFGPLLQVDYAETIQEAIEKANDTEYGLAAGIVCTERSIYEEFESKIVAGIVNWNQPLTGASTVAPFGGAKASGNHRPAGYFSADYCSRAVASIEATSTTFNNKLSKGLSF